MAFGRFSNFVLGPTFRTCKPPHIHPTDIRWQSTPPGFNLRGVYRVEVPPPRTRGESEPPPTCQWSLDRPQRVPGIPPKGQNLPSDALLRTFFFAFLTDFIPKSTQSDIFPVLGGKEFLPRPKAPAQKIAHPARHCTVQYSTVQSGTPSGPEEGGGGPTWFPTIFAFVSNPAPHGCNSVSQPTTGRWRISGAAFGGTLGGAGDRLPPSPSVRRCCRPAVDRGRCGPPLMLAAGSACQKNYRTVHLKTRPWKKWKGWGGHPPSLFRSNMFKKI